MRNFIKSIAFAPALLFFQLDAAAQCLPFQSGSNQANKIFNSTGISTLDAYLNAEKKYLESIFAVKVKMRILDDSDSPNAYATKNSDNPLSFDGSVYLGYTLLATEMKAENGLASVNGIMAHEFSHILQEKLKCTLEGAKRELHADYLAGFYMGHRGTYSVEELTAFGVSLYNKGEGEIWSASHHGTPEQRYVALLTGYKYAAFTDSPSVAYYSGIDAFDDKSGDLGETNLLTNKPSLEITTNYNVIIGDVVYKKAYAIKFEVASMTYSGLLLLENGVGVMRLKYNNKIVEQNIEMKNDAQIGVFLAGSNPIDAVKRNKLLDYSPDNFFFDKDDTLWVIDNKGSNSKVESSLLLERSNVDEWLVWLDWAK